MAVVLVTPYLQKPVTGSLSSSSTSFTTNDAITLTFTMTSANATGTVGFYRGSGTLIATGNVIDNSASVSVGVPQGNHTLYAIYNATAQYPSVTSANTIAVTVKTYTTLSLSYSVPNIGNPTGNAVAGQIVTLTATVTSGATGTVTFYSDGVSIGTASISGTTATLAYSSFSTGSYSLTASYAGTTVYAASSSNTAYISVDTAVTAASVTFNAPSYSPTWTVPPGVTNISILAIGAGGYTQGAVRGGGGGAISYANNVPVTPGQVLNITIGTGGFSGGSGSGVDSLVFAGNGGRSYSTPSPVALGYGGSGSGSAPGLVTYPGGNGGQGAVYSYQPAPSPVAPFNPGIVYNVSHGGGGGGVASTTSSGGNGGGAGTTSSSPGGAPNGGAGQTPSPYSQTTSGFGNNGGSTPGVPLAPSGYGYGAGGNGQTFSNTPTSPTPSTNPGGNGFVGILYGNTPSTKSWPTGT
jgi:hypothetical protein